MMIDGFKINMVDLNYIRHQSFEIAIKKYRHKSVYDNNTLGENDTEQHIFNLKRLIFR